MYYDLVKKISELNLFQDIQKGLSSLDESKNKLFVSPLYGVVKALLVKKLLEKEDRLILLLPESNNASEFGVELGIVGIENVILINDFKPESIQEKLTQISKTNKLVIVSTFSLLNLALPSREEINKTTTQIQLGGEVTYDELVEYLNLLDYQQDKFVEAPGEFSSRGSIIDFWSYSESGPVRLEFDGDFIESIRQFDPESQRSIEKVDTITLAGKLKNLKGNQTNGDSDIFDYLKNPLIIASDFELKNSKINIDELNFQSDDTKQELENIDKDELPEPGAEEHHRAEQIDLERIFQRKARWILEDELGSAIDRIDLEFSNPPTINANYNVLFNIFKEYADKSFDIYVTVENELQALRLKDLLCEFNEELSLLIEQGKLKIETLAIKEGFLHRDKKLLVLTDYQVFNKPYRTRTQRKKKYKVSKSKAFASIKRGDYVVHEDYGIGKYSGLETISIGESKQESMKILYNEGGIVYVNLNYLNLVKRYSSNENLKPSLSTLGSNEWNNTKRRTKKKIKEAARDLIKLYAKRKATQGYKFGSDTVWQKELEASFFYEDTPDQEKVTVDVKSDMESENPMDRLVCGDVGFGKTEIAVRAAFKSVQDGKQVALLVPTTILAEQHFNTFNDRLTQFPVSVAMLSRFQTKKQQTETLKNLENGQVDVVIGTHRLISKDVKFKDLGLLVIDEEHRFGVSAKEKLRSVKINVDTLTLTATPIPRTLNLSLLGARDLSIIATPPPNRQPIITNVATFDIFKIREWTLNELRRGGQVYFVHDRVQSIDKLAGYLTKHIPEIKIGIAHGQMKATQLENVIHGFLNKKFNVLLSTKIIESGIDIPNVNTIIVNRADRFGLAELHQLRGRVGRSTRQAFAYFIVPSVSGITKKALRRLQAIEEFTDIGAGFNLSMRDLEIRGAGNLLGKEQTGFINEIGFELYLKMIDQAVEELKYQEFKEIFKTLPKTEERTEPTLDTYFDIGIPETYMPAQTDRLNFYTALYAVKSIEELNELVEEMTDRYGNIPVLVNRLILAAKLRFYASFALFERIIIQRSVTIITLPKGEKEEYYKYNFVEMMRFILEEHKDKIKFEQKKDVMRLVVKNDFSKPEDLLRYLIGFSKDIKQLNKNETVSSTENNFED
ncbi:transcription-repair coupling factor [bacterium BMS3Abin03]|nr:transcription-repair coupling factor [bacterium BMS3Abin03]